MILEHTTFFDVFAIHICPPTDRPPALLLLRPAITLRRSALAVNREREREPPLLPANPSIPTPGNIHSVGACVSDSLVWCVALPTPMPSSSSSVMSTCVRSLVSGQDGVLFVYSICSVHATRSVRSRKDVIYEQQQQQRRRGHGVTYTTI